MANPNFVLTGSMLTLQAKGLDIDNTTVQFNGLARPVTGNFNHFAFITSQQNTNLFAKAGICVFEKPIVDEKLDVNTRFACLVCVPNGQIFLLYRNFNQTTITQVGTNDKILPLWFRLKRDGANLVAYYSNRPLSFVGGHNWQELTLVENFFTGWTTMHAGMMGLSKDPVLKSEVVFQGLNFGIGLPYEIDFNITSITWTRAFTGLSAMVNVQNSTKIYQLSIDNQNWTNNNVFEDLTEGQSYTFYVRDSNAPEQKVFKTETAPVSTGCSMSISSLSVVGDTAPNSFQVTVNTSNPDSLVLEYRMDTGVWKNNGIFNNVSQGSHTFYIRNRDQATCVKSKTQNIGSATTELINEIPEIFVPAPDGLNQVDLDFLGEWDVPLHPNPKFNDQRTVESILKGRNFRHQSTAGNVFKKGWTGIDVLICKLGTEWQLDPYKPNFRSTIDIRKTSVIDGGPSYPQLKLDNDSSAADIMTIDYTRYVDITNDYASNIPQKFDGSATFGSKYKGRMVLQDHEGGLNNVAIEFGEQDYVNRVVALHKAVLDGVGANTIVGFMYQGAPKQNVGFGITRAMYDEAADTAFTRVCATTANSTAKNFPSALLGKSIANLDNRIAAVVEVYFKLEAILPEKTQLKSLTGENLKSQNGVTLPLWTHFGVPQNNAGQANYKPSYLHWATHTAGCIGLNKKHLPAGRVVIIQTNHFNAGYFFTQFGGTPDSAIIQQHNDGFSRYKIPNYIVAGIEAISFFSGAIYYQWEDATSIGEPQSRALGETLPPYPQPVRLDYHGYAAAQAMAKRLAVDEATVGTNRHKLSDMIDGTEIYLNENIKVNYLTRAGFNTPKQIYPTDWMASEIPPVMAIVHLGKKLIAIWATVAYPGSQEVKEFDVHYDQNGYNFKKRIIISDYKNSLHIFSLEDTDPTSGGGTGGSTVAPPVITSNPNPPVVGSFVNFSTNASGFVIWYKNGVNEGFNGSTYPIASATAGDRITATRTVNGVVSGLSNEIIVGQVSSGGTMITEPDKPQFYFSNGHPESHFDNRNNLPAIHASNTRNVSNYAGKTLSGITMKSNYSKTEDLVWLENDKIKVGINLLRGGQIAWLSTKNATENSVYNGYDGGFQISCDIYQSPDGFQKNGKYSRKQWSETYQYNNTPRRDPATGIENPNIPEFASYNTTMGGDFNNNSQSLIAYGPIPNGYRVKFRPIFYTIDSEFAEVTIEVRYTLEPGASSVKCEYIYHSFRSDGQYNDNTFDSSALPACFIVNKLSKYQTYNGNAPWTNAPAMDGDLPINNENGRYAGAPPEPVLGIHATERFSCVYNPDNGATVGVYIHSNNASEYTKLKQLEVYADNGLRSGTEFSGGFTYFDFTSDLDSITNPIPDRSNFTKTMTAWIVAENSPAAARAEAYRIRLANL
jgi:hypothetical protein